MSEALKSAEDAADLSPWQHFKGLISSLRRRYTKSILVATGVLLIAALVLHKPVLRALTWPLRCDDGPRKADVIVVLGGGNGQRVRYGVELWHKKLSKSGKILMAGGPLYNKLTWSQAMADYAHSLGVPRSAIIVQTLSETTVSDAEESLKIAKNLNYKSILIVTDAYHSRRARYAFRSLAQPDMQIWCAALPFPTQDWWHNEVLARYLVSEYLKWIWTLL